MSTPDHLVRTHHRRRRYTALVWSLALALLAATLLLASRLAWLPPSSALDIGHWSLVIASALALTAWFLRARRLDARAVARALDSEWALKARIEAASELADNSSAFAAAQRSDASARLAGHRLPRAVSWHAALAVLAVAFLLFLAESTVFGIRIRSPAPLPPLAPADITASIEWRSPESEIKATSIEEIPLAAAAASRTGFRSASLEVSVNGEPRLSQPLDPSLLATLASPGVHPVALPLYLDEINAAEFDIVSYHLRADRASLEPSPPVTSPLQFIQIRPAREDVERQKNGGPSGQCSSMIGALKAAQLTLLKQNFLLAHAPISKTDAAWTEANTTVGTDQALLATKAGEIRTFAITEALPPLVVDNLTQVIPLMEEASTLIGATQNEPAARPQGRALALITEIEKIFRKMLKEAGSAGPPPPPRPADPFKDGQAFKLPPRKDTAAGQLEQLAQDQSDEARKNDPSSSAKSPGGKKSPSPAEQEALASRAAQLAQNQRLSPAAQQAAAQAARDAAAAATQLKQGDAAAARAPAHAAAGTLRDAAAAQEKSGREDARAQLEAARRALSEAAASPDEAARSARIAEVAAQLRADARAQQETGSAEAARRLATAAEAAQSASTAGSKPGSPGGKGEGSGSESLLAPADRAAQAAADAQAALSERGEAGSRAHRQLARGSGTAPEPGQGTSSSVTDTRATELILGTQLAHALINTPESGRLAGAVVNAFRAGADYAAVVTRPDVRASVDQLRVMLAAALSGDRRDETIRRFNPEDLDPAYRETIETYFERLSREARQP
ncbi:MAG: hypothetical protein K0R17_2360 [Rariglobus sp.]|nr:hypothetical protein [Rariglobus sp.]